MACSNSPVAPIISPARIARHRATGRRLAATTSHLRCSLPHPPVRSGAQPSRPGTHLAATRSAPQAPPQISAQTRPSPHQVHLAPVPTISDACTTHLRSRIVRSIHRSGLSDTNSGLMNELASRVRPGVVCRRCARFATRARTFVG